MEENHLSHSVDPNRLCHHLYVIAMLASAVVLFFAPLHLHYTVQAPIVETFGGGQVRFMPAGGQVPRVGATVHVFRYHDDWRLPIGRLRVISADPTEGVLAQAIEKSFRFPLGIQGTVTRQSPDSRRLRVNVGEDAGLLPNHQVQLFRDGRRFATARVMEVQASDAELESEGDRRLPVFEAQASIYTVQNSVSYLALPWLENLEVAGCVGLVLLLLYRACRPRGWSVLVRSSRRGLAFLAAPRRIWAVALAPLFLYYGVRFLLRCWDYAIHVLARLLGLPMLHGLGQAESMILNLALVAAAVAFFWVMAATGRSPWAVLRDKTRFVPPTYQALTTRWVDRAGIVWLLQVVVVYAFAHTLLDVLAANIRVMTTLSFPEVSVNLTTAKNAFHTVVQLIRLGPVHSTWAVSLQALNLLIFSVTIVGSLVGYLYGVVAILWGQKCVRNVDFTVTGWLVNAFCYGPLLGATFWGMMPSLSGLRPGIVDGPIHFLGLGCGLLLNLLYSLSIYNMWTRFGVMVDKGMVRNLMFSVVRHPSYTLEGVMFAVLALGHIANHLAFIALAVYCFQYWLRSERDEDFMLASNEEYEGYRRQVPYKYLPGLI
jgi:protein-S-isoprenylcysteine O-methyltransferase Ste14